MKGCGRQITKGPGSCSYWFESCPKKVPNCFQRFIRDNGGNIDMEKALEWQRANQTYDL